MNFYILKRVSSHDMITSGIVLYLPWHLAH